MGESMLELVVDIKALSDEILKFYGVENENGN